jgi:hypothetical protein
MTVMADFLLLGQTGVGSFALSSDKTKLFAVAIGAYLDGIEEIFNRQAVPQLFRLNTFPDIDRLPKLVHGDIESADLVALADFIQKMSAAGALNFLDDPDFEAYVRKVSSLPARPEGPLPEPPKPPVLPDVPEPKDGDGDEPKTDDGEPKPGDVPDPETGE